MDPYQAVASSEFLVLAKGGKKNWFCGLLLDQPGK